MQLEFTTVINHTAFEGGYRLLELAAPGISSQVQPGQFVHLKIPHMEQALLRRPFSVFKAGGNSISILYKAVGSGTRTMQFIRVGETLSLIGPLGKPFPPAREDAYPVLVAGGYGMAALYLAARRLKDRPGTAFFGGRTQKDILCVAEFTELGWEVIVSTEDGSLGEKGMVTDALNAWEHDRDNLEYFCCGPTGMLKAIGSRADAERNPAWLSVDENMGCAVGACLTCVVKVRKEAGGWSWARSCKEGPVFSSKEILWEEVE